MDLREAEEGPGVVRLCGKLFAVVIESDGIPVYCCEEGHEDTKGVDRCVSRRQVPVCSGAGHDVTTCSCYVAGMAAGNQS